LSKTILNRCKKWCKHKYDISRPSHRLIQEGVLFAIAIAWTIVPTPAVGNELQLTIKVGKKLNLMWNASSVTLNPSPSIIPNTQLEVSENLKMWKPISKLYPGGLRSESKLITITIPKTNGIRYFRVNSQINLKNANLQKSNLVGADLRGADLTNANLTQVDLAMANLDGANLTEANLTRANLAEATLGNVDLTSANLTGAIIAPWVTFPETTYMNTIMPDGSITTHDTEKRLLIQLYVDGAPKTNLSGKDFSEWDLRGIELQKRDLTRCNFTQADLRNVKLDQANLANANLTLANLRGASGFDPNEHKGIIIRKTVLPDGSLSN
jgi:uncharacterized protein YjbI with pentapeptide repeats